MVRLLRQHSYFSERPQCIRLYTDLLSTQYRIGGIGYSVQLLKELNRNNLYCTQWFDGSVAWVL